MDGFNTTAVLTFLKVIRMTFSNNNDINIHVCIEL